MKLSTLMFASLMSLTSAAAFAEGGSERSKEFYQNFSFIQQQTHGAAEQRMASADGKTLKVDTVNEEQPNS
ncbi:hypothetical protein [Pseudomonas khavaziana]|uniref:hypothetical protein n=1 Tax=Pseudomonas khavaziana TaxID=2842351 RepID=UPI001C3DBD44|nr:hypothetical protein [Pseudomonas khavaziana]MBV4482600.1 hypothetical protein [Pseudomonas khavaziana]